MVKTYKDEPDEDKKTEMNIHQKLIEVRKVVPYLKKDEKGYEFMFVKSSQVLGTLKAKMDSLGLLLIPKFTSKNVSDHTTKKGGHNYFTEIEMVFTWVDADNPEDTITCPWYGQGLDAGERGVGKAYTYAEKYFLLKFFNIPTDKDDPDAFQDKVGSKIVGEDNQPGPIIKAQIKSIGQLMKETETDPNDDKFILYLKNTFREVEVANLNHPQARRLEATLQTKLDKQNSVDNRVEK